MRPLDPPDTPEFQAAIAAQMQAANPLRSAWVEANAGSGKTKVLIDRVARLLLSRPDGRPGAEPDSILCITYTKAAANEMLSRLFDRLGRWSTQSDEALRETLARLEGRPAGSFDAPALDRARSLFARALETPGGLRIETIHAFCARILRRFPLEAGVPPGFQEIEEADADRLWRRALETHLEEAVIRAPDALETLSDPAGGHGIDAVLDQLQAERASLLAFVHRLDGQNPGGVLRETLGLGTETRSDIIARAMGPDLPVDALRDALAEIRDKLDPDPGKEKASRKLAEALDCVLATSDPSEAFETYLAAIAGAKRNWPSGSNPYAGKALATGLVADLFRRKTSGGDAEGTEIVRMKAVLEAVQRAGVAERTEALIDLALPVVEAYERIKRERNVLDFEDLILSTRALFLGNGAAQWVLYKLDGGLNHVLLDEAQDTSPAQWDLINALVADFHAGLGAERRSDPRTQFVVGDPKQSIYSFQGADQAKFEAEKTGFESGQKALGQDPLLPDMTMSFRSAPQVLEFVDTVRRVAPLGEADPDARLPDDADLLEHQPRRSNQPGRVELWPLMMPTEESDDSGWTAPTDHVPESAPTRRLARKVAEEAAGMLRNGHTVWREGSEGRWQREPVQPGDFLILVRRRSTLFEALISELKSFDIPVAGADRLKLTESLAVQDCLNLIRFALQPANDLVLAEILRGPFCDLIDDDHDLFPLGHDRRPGETLWHRLCASDEPRFQRARDVCESAIKSRHLPAFSFLSAQLDHRDAQGRSGWDLLLRRFGTPARDPVDAILRKALSFDQAEPAGLLGFLSGIESDTSDLKRELSAGAGAVRVMTVHGAKGLQAPIVILPDTTSATRPTSKTLFTTQGCIPLYAPSGQYDCPETAELRNAENAASERESRRLLYVALTRAQDRLIICGAGHKQTKTGFSSSSWYRWCQRAMSQLTGSGEEMDDPNSIRALGDLPPLSDAGTGHRPQDETLPPWLSQPVAETVRKPGSFAPSQLAGTRETILRPFSTARRHALQRGRRVHELLQRLPHIPPADREQAAYRFLRADADLSDQERQEIVATTMSTLEDPVAQRLFSAAGRSEVPIVGTLPDGRLVNGRIDRLVIDDREIELVDFKSDRPAPDGPDDVELSYRLQLAAYAHVLQDIYPGHSVKCGLLYTDGPKLFVFSSKDLSETLKRVTTPV